MTKKEPQSGRMNSSAKRWEYFDSDLKARAGTQWQEFIKKGLKKTDEWPLVGDGDNHEEFMEGSMEVHMKGPPVDGSIVRKTDELGLGNAGNGTRLIPPFSTIRTGFSDFVATVRRTIFLYPPSVGVLSEKRMPTGADQNNGINNAEQGKSVQPLVKRASVKPTIRKPQQNPPEHVASSGALQTNKTLSRSSEQESLLENHEINRTRAKDIEKRLQIDLAEVLQEFANTNNLDILEDGDIAQEFHIDSPQNLKNTHSIALQDIKDDKVLFLAGQYLVVTSGIDRYLLYLGFSGRCSMQVEYADDTKSPYYIFEKLGGGIIPLKEYDRININDYGRATSFNRIIENGSSPWLDILSMVHGERPLRGANQSPPVSYADQKYADAEEVVEEVLAYIRHYTLIGDNVFRENLEQLVANTDFEQEEKKHIPKVDREDFGHFEAFYTDMRILQLAETVAAVLPPLARVNVLPQENIPCIIRDSDDETKTHDSDKKRELSGIKLEVFMPEEEWPHAIYIGFSQPRGNANKNRRSEPNDLPEDEVLIVGYTLYSTPQAKGGNTSEDTIYLSLHRPSQFLFPDRKIPFRDKLLSTQHTIRPIIEESLLTILESILPDSEESL